MSSTDFQIPLQISQLVVKDAFGTNIARSSTCSAANYHQGQPNCQKAIDGTLANRDWPDMYHSAGGNREQWYLLDLAGTHAVTSVDYYNRAGCCQERATNYILELLDSKMNVLFQRKLNSDAVQSFKFSGIPTYQCQQSFLGGGWVLVRRVKAGSTWHPATDDLTGNDVYGTYGNSTSDSTFSVPFSSFFRQREAILFMTGIN
jgi:hypothetical protein